ncbi:MAG: peptide chain release factor 1 [Candidatus Falkowbacteria bacterium]
MTDYKEIKTEYKKIESELSSSDNIGDPKKMIELNKKYSELKRAVDLINELENITQQIENNQDILGIETDVELKTMAEEELRQFTEQQIDIQKQLDEELNPKNPLDKKNAIIEIRAGTGGDESALFTANLYGMYVKYAEKQGWKVSIMNTNRIGIGGFKEIIFEITSPDSHENRGEIGVYGNFKFESGTHRVQRVPETEKAGRIHTSAVTVAVFPEAEEVDVKIKQEDLRIDTFSSSGPGGQSVNTTDSAVRIIHLPTNTIVTCQDEKSQQQNKIKAMQVLRSRILANIEQERRAKESADRKKQIGSGDRSEKIRTYNFPQDRITDHRIKKSWHNIDAILAGNLQPIIDALHAIQR